MSDLTQLVFLAVAVAAFGIVLIRSYPNEEVGIANMMCRGLSFDIEARVRATFARRKSEERRNQISRRVTLAAAIVILVATGSSKSLRQEVFAPALSLIVLAATYDILSVRRAGGGRRAASLSPRRASAFVPAWLFCVPILTSIGAILALVSRSVSANAGSFISIGASLLAYAGCFAAAQSPAIVGDDPAFDSLIDSKMRASRIRQLLALSAMAPLLALAVYQTSEFRTLVILGLGAFMLWSQAQLKLRPEEIERALSAEAA